MRRPKPTPDRLHVCIVGGGSAGWIAAATLEARFGRAIDLTVVESPDTPRIGVGEATIPTFRNVLKRARIPEREAMARCDATFKHGIRFDDWSGAGSTAWHPFHRIPGPAAAADWLATDGSVAFAKTVTAQPGIAEAGLAPKTANLPDYEGSLPYAYHLDADKLAGLLQDTLVARGVRHRALHVVSVRRDDSGVAALETAEGDITADLYIDATGFRALLSLEAQGSGWTSYADRLLCDRAVTLRIPTETPAPRPFTTATALSAGWAWDIGLRHRRGRGYVFSSKYLSDEDAEAELRATEGGTEVDARLVRFRTGRMAAPWLGNVVALGLTAGFLEPLESTGLFLADYAARVLCEMFPPRSGIDMSPLARRYNALVVEMHDDLADFIALHYAVARRRDTPFWRDAPEAALNDRLRALLALWELRPPSFADLDHRYAPFTTQAWEFILLGFGWRPKDAAPGPNAPAAVASRLSEKLPYHADVLHSIAADPDQTGRRIVN